jgi:putative transposase
MKQTLTPALARVFKRLHYPFDVMLMCVRWYVANGLSVRNLEEMMAERHRGRSFDRASLGDQAAANS